MRAIQALGAAFRLNSTPPGVAILTSAADHPAAEATGGTAVAAMDAIRLLSIDATGRWNNPLRDIAPRPYPFPFAAAFALANENTWPSVEMFEEVHAYLNGQRPTAFGPGLGLEVGDSLAIDDRGSPRLTVGDAGDTDENRIETLSEAGWLDSIHCPDVARLNHLIAALSRIPGPARPRVFLGPLAPRARAALETLGVIFFADDGLIEIDKFGDHHDHRIVQRFHLAALEYDWSRWLGGRERADAEAEGVRLADSMNRTLQVEAGNDVASFRFKRYRGPWLASMPTFSAQVTSVLLDQLTNLGGAVIVQQQLGRWSLIGAPPERSQARPNTAPALDRHAVAAWREIAERQEAGRLWVATTARLLDWLWRRQSLRFTVEKAASKWTIRLDEFSCPILGSRTVGADDLNGLAFTAPEAAPEVAVVIGAEGSPIAMERSADPAHRLRHAVYRPWRPLNWPQA